MLHTACRLKAELEVHRRMKRGQAMYLEYTRVGELLVHITRDKLLGALVVWVTIQGETDEHSKFQYTHSWAKHNTSAAEQSTIQAQLSKAAWKGLIQVCFQLRVPSILSNSRDRRIERVEQHNYSTASDSNITKKGQIRWASARYLPLGLMHRM